MAGLGVGFVVIPPVALVRVVGGTGKLASG